jgi:hypothetical protein
MSDFLSGVIAGAVLHFLIGQIFAWRERRKQTDMAPETAGVVLCKDCAHVDKSETNTPAYWKCLVSLDTPKRTAAPFVDGKGLFQPAEFKFCQHVNTDGKCPKYERK